MSSLRNAVKRIAHKERSQPTDRKHLGILEKKKDYKQRAIDYHRKEDRIKTIKQKVSMRNPDEFYFGMKSSKIEDGKHRSNEDYRKLSPELVKVMKDQDLSYVRMQKQKDMKKAEKLQSSLHFLEEQNINTVGTKRKHTLFVETAKDAQEFNTSEYFGTIPEFAGRTFNRLRKADIEKLSKDISEPGKELSISTLRTVKKKNSKIAKKLSRARSGAYREMESRRERADKMKTAEDHLITEKLLAGKGRKRKIKALGDGRPAQYKWRKKRLR